MNFNAVVRMVDGDKITLDNTLFFPGGGGQACDKGVLEFGSRKFAVERVGKTDNQIIHYCPDHSLKSGFRVKGIVDMGRRDELTRAHTGEHLFLGRLLELNPEISFNKIHIDEDDKSIFLDGKLDWKTILEAEKRVNEKILACDSVTVKEMPKSAAEKVQGLRIKLDRLEEKDKIRIVTIGDYDRAACTGLHVENTRDIDFFLVKKFTEGKIEFLVGKKAREEALSLSKFASSSSDILETTPDRLESTVKNMKKKISRFEQSFRENSEEILSELTSEEKNGKNLYINSFENIERKKVVERAGELIRNPNTCVIFTLKEESTFLIFARSEDIHSNCVEILNKALSPHGGRGGGKENFAMGGLSSADPVITEKVIKILREAI